MGRPEIVKRYVELKRGFENRQKEVARKDAQFRRDYAPILNDLDKIKRSAGNAIKTGINKYGGPSLTGRAEKRSSRMRFF